jgi:hypothetical protein
MTLDARDELRHVARDDPLWRESVYWNFNDPEQKLGAWIYVWVLPGPPAQSGIIVSFYSGDWPDPSVFTKAMAAPSHCIREPGRWIYCFQQSLPVLVPDDFDDFSMCGLRLERLSPLDRYALTLTDDRGNTFNLESRFFMPPFDYSDGVNSTPAWLATNRYHRNHSIRGELRIDGEEYQIDCTGDSDHSWGTRDWSVMGRHIFKMWSFQTEDGRLAASVINQGTDTGTLALGYTKIDGTVASASSITSSAHYDANGVQTGIDVSITDDRGRLLHATCRSMHSYVGWRVGANGEFWGYEGVGVYDSDGYGKVPGAVSYFWPDRITARLLAESLPETD